MRNELTAVIERDGEWFIAYCREIPGANGQGRTKDEARASLADAIALILDDRRADGLRSVPLHEQLARLQPLAPRRNERDTPLSYGAFRGGRMSTEEDFRLAEWRLPDEGKHDG